MNLILLVFSFVCFVIAVFNFGAPHWNKLLAAGLAFYVAAQLFGNVLGLFKG